MKKPIISLRNKKDVACLLIGAALLTSVLWLFFAPEESAAVFSDGEHHFFPKGIYSLLNKMV